MDPFSLAGKVALVTGASGGLGGAIAEAMAEAGAHLVLAGRNVEQLSAVARTIRQSGGQADYEAFDLGDEAAVLDAMQRIGDRHGAPHILVNNAGAAMRRAPLLESTLEQWDDTHRINTRAVYLLCREAARAMMERREGRIINISSYVAAVGRDNLQAYAASKAGLEGLTRSLACELGPYGITVNSIAPGLFLTERTSPIKDNAAVFNKYLERIALGRAANPREIGGVAVFLASSASSYMTGTTIRVDGGVVNAMPVRVS